MENRFQVLPLEGLVNFKTGKLNSNAAKPDGMFPFFTCSQETFRTDTWSFDGEYVLLAGNNAAGIYPLKYFNGKFDAYQRTYAINSIDENVLVTRYVYYALRLQLELMKSISTGVATKFLTLSLLNRTQIPIPHLPTQQKITAILSAYDDLIENNLRRIKLLEEMAQNLYREWFVKFRFPACADLSAVPDTAQAGASAGRPGHQHARFIDSPLGRIPEGWEVVAFTEIADVLSGGTPKTTVQEFWGGSIPFFGPKDAPESFYVTNTEKAITEIGLSKCNSKLYPKDTVFITARGTVGKVVMSSMGMAMNQSCYALRGKQGINQLYLFLATREQVEYLKKNTGGATFDTIVVDTFRRMLVPKPGNEVIVRFSQLIQPGMELIVNILKKNTTLRRTRDLLLPKLISGEVDVSELDITVPEEAA